MRGKLRYIFDVSIVLVLPFLFYVLGFFLYVLTYGFKKEVSEKGFFTGGSGEIL